MRNILTFLLLICLMTLPYLSLAQQPVTLAGLEDQDNFLDWSDHRFFERMQEKTGISFEFEEYRSLEAWQKRKETFLVPQSVLPEVLFKAELSPEECFLMLENGVLIDLAPLIQEHAPNLFQLLQEYPQVRAAITLPGGQIPALPYINLAGTQNCLWINQDWLTELKLEMPTTAEGLSKVLEAFKNEDPNRNARKDEVPLSYLGAYDLKYLGHAYGLAANDFNVFHRDGQAKFMPLESSFRPFIVWLNGMYHQGLLDPDGFSTIDSLRQVTQAKGTNKYGAILSPLPNYYLPMEWVGDYKVVPPLLYSGKQIYRSVASMAVTGTFAITSTCRDPEAMLQWVDILFTEEGAILASIGEEGIDYLIDGDKTWRKTEAVSQSGSSNASIVTGIIPPGVSSDDFQRRYFDPMVRSLSEQIDKVASVAKEPFPPFLLTAGQAERLAPLQNSIGRFVDESIARWVMGEWELNDERFSYFEAELNRLGLPEFMGIWQDLLNAQQEEMK